MLSKKIIRIGIVVLSLLVLSVSVWAIRNRSLFKAKTELKRAAPKKKKKKYDPLLLQRFKEELESMDTRKEELFMSGTFSIQDYSEPGSKAVTISYLYSKKGSVYYYRLGNTETYNEKGLNIYINHGLKKVQVSDQVIDSTRVPFRIVTDNLLANLQEEEYDLVSRPAGKMQTISLLNQKHITCKEYSLTYDSLSGKVSGVFIRLTNLAAPLRTDNEKHVRYLIDTSEKESHIERYLGKKIVEEENGEWQLTEAYKQYELIR